LVAADLAAAFSRGSSAAVVSIRRLHLAAMLASLSAAIRHLDTLWSFDRLRGLQLRLAA
jgi:hypothetical protein